MPFSLRGCVKIRLKKQRLINWGKKRKEKLAEIKQSNRYQQEMFSSLEAQVEEDSIVRIIDKIVDKLSEERSEERIK